VHQVAKAENLTSSAFFSASPFAIMSLISESTFSIGVVPRTDHTNAQGTNAENDRMLKVNVPFVSAKDLAPNVWAT